VCEKVKGHDGLCRSVTGKLISFLPCNTKGKKNCAYTCHGIQTGM